uniref:Uncharacterized protein n=1 Tax=Arundo donax TaxID=35708 RepID=A0A0A8YAV4_ARUDO
MSFQTSEVLVKALDLLPPVLVLIGLVDAVVATASPSSPRLIGAIALEPNSASAPRSPSSSPSPVNPCRMRSWSMEIHSTAIDDVSPLGPRRLRLLDDTRRSPKPRRLEPDYLTICNKHQQQNKNKVRS